MESSAASTNGELKLNLGCGFNHRPGFVNVDISEGCDANVVCDLSKSPWPWANDSVKEAVFDYSMEQMGESVENLRHVLSELYRVCANDANIHITAAHPRHDQFFLNPLCHHRLSPDFFQLLSVQRNLSMISQGAHYDVLGLKWGVNFEVTHFKLLVGSEFQADFESGRMSEKELRERIRFQNNICPAFEVDLRTVKAPAAPGSR